MAPVTAPTLETRPRLHGRADAIGVMMTRQTRIHGSMAGVLLVAFGCSAGDRSGADDSGERVIGPEAVQVIGTSETIGRIVDVAGGRDGTVWVLNNVEPFLVALGPGGEVVRTWGRRGGGPSEFRDPNVLVPDPVTGELWVYDRGRHQLLRVDGPEDPVQTIGIPQDLIPTARVASFENFGAGEARGWIRGVDAGFLFAIPQRGVSPFDRLWNTDFILLTREGEESVAWAMSQSLADPASRYGAGVTEFIPYPLWAHCPDGSMAVYDPLTNRIGRRVGGEAAGDSIVLPEERRLEVTMDRIFRMAFAFMRDRSPAGQKPDSAQMYTTLAGQWNGMKARSSPVFPEYADMDCTVARTLWLQQFDPDEGRMGRTPIWLRIDRSGSIVRFRLPDSFRPMRFEATRILGSQRGEYDVESVAWLALPGEEKE